MTSSSITLRAVIVLVLGALGACGSDPVDPRAGGSSPTPSPTASASARAPKTFSVSEKESGQTIQAVTGDRIVITLDANATTGYSWQFASEPAGMLKEIRATYSPTPHPPGVVGSGGFQLYEYLVVGSGSTTISLVYRGPGGDEGGSFTLTVASQ